MDLWKNKPVNGAERFTWFYHNGTGFRMDYVFVSPGQYSKLKDYNIYHDAEVRENGISDHSAVFLEFNLIPKN